MENSGVSRRPKVFIIILNYNGRDYLRNCLLSVFRLKYQNFEVVVVDNNSTDGSLEQARLGFPRCHYIKNGENLGFSAGNNIGIRFALERGADFVFLLNNDTEVSPDVLGKLVGGFEGNSGLGLASPLIYKNKEKDIWFSGGRIDWWRMKSTNNIDMPGGDGFISCGFVSGCALMVKKDVFSRAGLLDEDFFLYWEDVDFSVRAKREGFDIGVIPTASVFHFEASESAPDKKTYWLVLSGLLFFKKNARPYWRLWLVPYMFGRKLKNWLDLRLGWNPLARIVDSAYRDFHKNV